MVSYSMNAFCQCGGYYVISVSTADRESERVTSESQ